MRAMQRALRRFEPPFIATITITGEVTVIWNAKGKLEKPIRLKTGR